MATEWQLEYDGTTQTLAAWGLSGLTRQRVNLGVDRVMFRHQGAAFDGTPLFPVDGTVKIHRVVDEVSTQWFEGRVDRVPRYGGATAENMAYHLVGPWYYLERLIFQQNWNVATAGTGDLAPVYKSHVLLFQNIDGTTQTMDSQLAEVLAYAKTVAAKPLDYDTADFPALELPISEGQDLTCAEVIRRALRWTPDAVAWWDYTTSPPTFHVNQRADLAAGTLDLTSTTARVDNVEIGSREDLQLPAVYLKFEQVSSINEENFLTITEQKAPADTITGLETNALVATIQLEGYSESRVTAAVETAAVDANSSAWWQGQLPWLANARIQVVSVTEASRTSTLPRQLTRGQLASWMRVSKADDTVSAKVRYRVYCSTTQDETTLLGEYEELQTVRLTATNAVTKTYSALESFSTAEPVPTGLAAGIYAANATLQWEGSLTVTEEEITGTADLLGNTLDLTNGHADWATMLALVQDVTEFVDNGTTRLRFGPAQHLGPSDLVELLRVNRDRRIYINPATRTSGLHHASSVALGNQTPQDAPTGGSSQPSRIRVGTKANPLAGEIDLDPTPADVTTGTGGVVKLRWTHLCDEETGEDRYALVMRSGTFAALPAGAEVED